ncbi:MAG TPA: hypothetical protein VKE40_18730 [Gemmataceae bacterium]|nr:hypothetical protein [Gemmataceae bacterium]
MAFHEQHERLCPTCGHRISATAPKCFNCGAYVNDEDDDGDDEPRGRRPIFMLASAVVAAVIYIAALVYLLNP